MPRRLRWVRTRYAYQPPALGTYRTHRAACPRAPRTCTYGVRVPASGVGYVPRTVPPQVVSVANGALFSGATAGTATLTATFGGADAGAKGTASAALLVEEVRVRVRVRVRVP